MAAALTDDVLTVATRKRKPASETNPRDRIDLRVEPEFYARVEAAAQRFGLNLSAYIRMAVSERLERDEAAQAKPKK
jgi:hypothetical protein